MPLNLSFTHLMVVAIVALVVLGPERLPGVARTAGNLYREWQRVKGGLEVEVREAMNEFTEPFREPIQQVHDTVRGVVDDIRQGPGSGTEAVASAGAPAIGVAELPSLGGSSALFSPGPVVDAVAIPELGPPPDPDTFVPFQP